MRDHNPTQVQNLDDKILTVALVVVGSFACGLIPLVYGLQATTADGQAIVPTEATLWVNAWKPVD